MKPPSDSHSPFSLEGRYLGLIREGGKFKYLRLGIAKEELEIKLSKESRASCQAVLHPDDWIQVIGEMSVSRETGELKLKATQISNLDACAICTPAEDPKVHLERLAAMGKSAAAMPQGTSPAQLKLKLLMCQKSGCQKKGSKKHRLAIEAVLRDRNLHHQVVIQETGCLGKCSMAPNLVLMPGKKRISGMKPEAIAELLSTLST